MTTIIRAAIACLFMVIFTAASHAGEVDTIAACLSKAKHDGSKKDNLQKAKCFTDEVFETLAIAEAFVTRSSLYCRGGETEVSVKSDLFNEAASREFELGDDNMPRFFKLQAKGIEMTDRVLIENNKDSYPMFCARVNDMYGPSGSTFPGLYSVNGRHIGP